MNKDIRLATGFKGHRKRKRLVRALGFGAEIYLIDLWLTVAVDCPEGILVGWDEEDICDACGWEKEPEELITALINSNWLEKNSDGDYALHDWCDHQGWACKARVRSDAAKAAAASRWGKKESVKKTRAERMKEARSKGNHTEKDWKEMKDFFGTCVKCDGETGLDNVDRDHIKPIYQGGCHSIKNIQPLCAKCNSSKTGETIDHRPAHCERVGKVMPEKWMQTLCDNSECCLRDVCVTHAVMPAPSPNPSPSPSPLPKEKELSDESNQKEEIYKTKKKRTLKGKRLETFNLFWDAFDYKSGKASAADAWLDIDQLTDSLVNQIINAAKKEASGRAAILARKSTPIMAQGWITARRWEDEVEQTTLPSVQGPNQHKMPTIVPRTYAQAQDAEQRGQMERLKLLREQMKTGGTQDAEIIS
jgi:5-methylcytosine-specific restriction endonuclease McrA